VFLSLCFDSFEYRPNACKTSSVVIGVVRIFAKCQRIVYFFAKHTRRARVVAPTERAFCATSDVVKRDTKNRPR
jgi:hypothetical protein